MTTLIVSDVHLGSFYNRARELSAFVRSASFVRLVILGDLFDKPCIERLREEEWEFLDLIRSLSRRKEIIWVEGNHDEGLYDTIPSLLNIQAAKQFVWEIDRKRFLAIHGHQFDAYSRNRSILASCAGELYRFLRRIDLTFERDIFHSLCFENGAWKRSSDIVTKGALEYGKNSNADFVFCGHTHRAFNVRRDSVEYFNTGCWNDMHCHYVTVGNDGVSLKKYSEYGEVVKTGVRLAAQQAT
ncbi:MAG TPA: UDP-2,3-diacylglucosamine diphosphatase [Thermodesulfobacteriota bacterium]|nr:UDP-2,3-diacylglucosamine diphosphatase [Thermodesulfobacteriota bacterium]